MTQIPPQPKLPGVQPNVGFSRVDYAHFGKDIDGSKLLTWNESAGRMRPIEKDNQELPWGIASSDSQPGYDIC